MDPVTHLVSGGLVSRMANDQNAQYNFLGLCMVSAIAPDVDFVVGVLGPEAALAHHRGITHSFAGGLLIALLLTLVFWMRRKPFRFLTGFTYSYLLILVHIFLDLVTSYGTQILAPFSNHRFSLDSVFIIDPVMTLPAIGLLAAGVIMKNRAKKLAIAGIVILICYPLINVGIRIYLQERLENRLKAQSVRFQSLDLLPDPFTPFFWKVILTDGSEYRSGTYALIQPNTPVVFTSYRRAEGPLVQAAVQGSSMFRTYMWFAAYPTAETEITPDGPMITLTDLRFQTNMFRNRRSPFKLTAYFDRQLHLTRWEYQRPFRERARQILE